MRDPARPRPSLIAFALLLLVGACGPASIYGGGRVGQGDLGVGGGDGSDVNADLAGLPPGADLSGVFTSHDAAMGPCDPVANPCPKGQRCYGKQCVPDNGTCTTDEECQNDSYCVCAAGGGDMGACQGGVCLSYGTGPRGLFDPECTSGGFSAAEFVAPKLKCSWNPGPQSGTLATPIVADLDGDGKPEIVFQSFPQGFTALHGADCSVYFTKTFSFSDSNQTNLAVADLDGDGKPEIIGVDASRRVVVFDNHGNQLATSPTPIQFSGGPQFWGGPSIADVDNVAPPEIIVGAQVTRYVKGQPQLQVLWSKSALAPQFGPLSIAADLDGDGRPEVIVGKDIFDGVTGADKTPAGLKGWAGAGAYPAVGDFNGDGKPDIVLVQSYQGQQRVAVFDYAGNKFIFGPFDVPSGWGGPPTVADFDGDGKPEFASAGLDYYYVFDLKCVGPNKPKFCDQSTNYGVRWKKKTQDHSSGSTGSSVFDFNGDGIAEVVYRDECWLRVYNGPDGKVDFAASVTSATALELPVIADVDNDGHADLVVSSDSYGGQPCPQQPEADTGAPFGGKTSGIYVYQDPMNRWMPSRGVWNQHSYHITNVNDDLTVPTVEKPNWKTFNNYRQNVQGITSGPKVPQVDTTGGTAPQIDNGGSDCKTGEKLWAKICNRGTATSMTAIPGTFYTADPRKPGAVPICTAATTMVLKPGDCETVHCVYVNPPSMGMGVDVWFRADDDGKGGHPQNECKNGNDLLLLPNVHCDGIG